MKLTNTGHRWVRVHPDAAIECEYCGCEPVSTQAKWTCLKVRPTKQEITNES